MWFSPTIEVSFFAPAANNNCEENKYTLSNTIVKRNCLGREKLQEMSEASIWIRCQTDLISHRSCGKVITAHSGWYACCQRKKYHPFNIINRNTSVNLCCCQTVWSVFREFQRIRISFLFFWIIVVRRGGVLYHCFTFSRSTLFGLFYFCQFWSLTQVLVSDFCTFKCSEVVV